MSHHQLVSENTIFKAKVSTLCHMYYKSFSHFVVWLLILSEHVLTCIFHFYVEKSQMISHMFYSIVFMFRKFPTHRSVRSYYGVPSSLIITLNVYSEAFNPPVKYWGANMRWGSSFIFSFTGNRLSQWVFLICLKFICRGDSIICI